MKGGPDEKPQSTRADRPGESPIRQKRLTRPPAPTPLVVRSLTFGITMLLASVGVLLGAFVIIGGAGGGEAIFFFVLAAGIAALDYAEKLRQGRRRLASAPPASAFAPLTPTREVLRQAVVRLPSLLLLLAAIGGLFALLGWLVADETGVHGFVLITAVGCGIGLAEAAYAAWLRKWERRHDLVLYSQDGDSGGQLFAARATIPGEISKGGS